MHAPADRGTFAARLHLAPDVVVTCRDPGIFLAIEHDRKRDALERLRTLWTPSTPSVQPG